MKFSDARFQEEMVLHPQPGKAEILSWIDDSPDPASFNPENSANGPENEPLAQRSSGGNSLSFDATGCPLDWGGSSNNDIFLQPKMPNRVHWSIPWSDLMMTMFILFVVMFIYHSSQKEFLSPDGLKTKETKANTINLPPSTDNKVVFSQSTLPKLYNLSKKTLEAKNLNNFASVDLLPDRAVRIILTGDLLFDLGEATLKEAAKDKLEKIASLIAKTPYKVNIVGHTDDIPIKSAQFPSNWELSLIRASVVARFFIEDLSLPGNKFFLSGHSSFQPVRPNSSPENRAANRRVEIIITKERPFGIPLGSKSFSFSPQENESLISSKSKNLFY
jgi:chemotaxis protein MotB